MCQFITIAVLIISWVVLYHIDKKKLIRMKVSKWLLKSPLSRTLIFFLTTVVTGILCNSLVSELFINGKVEWSALLTTTSSKPLIVVLIIDFIYNWLTYPTDEEILKYTDLELATAVIIRDSLPDLTEQIKNKLRSGEMTIEDWKSQLFNNK